MVTQSQSPGAEVSGGEGEEEETGGKVSCIRPKSRVHSSRATPTFRRQQQQQPAAAEERGRVRFTED